MWILNLNENYFQLTTKDCLELLKTDVKTGLFWEQIKERQKLYGYNILPELPKPSILFIFIRQFKSPLIYLLLIAAFISLFLGDYIDVTVIFLALFLNASIGAYQEEKSQKILDEIKNLVAPTAKVIRNSTAKMIKSESLVPGDIVILQPGFKVPADGRVLESFLLEVNQSAFTGESAPVEKNNSSILHQTAVPQRSNMVYLGTTVMRGRGIMVVTKIGEKTETGKLSKTLESLEKPKTPLFEQIDKFSRIILWIILSASALIFVYGIFQHQTLAAFNSAVTLAVSAIPEGLPAMIAVTLAVGVHQMARQKALVQNLSAIDTLGQVDTLISDKTGTLTLNKLAVSNIILPDNKFSFKVIPIEKLNPFEVGLKDLLLAATLANDASLDQKNNLATNDDPLEVSLIKFVQDFHEHRFNMLEKNPRIFELPFESKYRYMAAFHRSNAKMVKIFIKGAPENILEFCESIKLPRTNALLSKNIIKNFIKELEILQKSGQKVIAFAIAEIATSKLENIKWQPDKLRRLLRHHMQLVGAVALADSVRPEAHKAIKELKLAGINIIMATGDHPAVAQSIALKVGINPDMATDKDLQNKFAVKSLREKNVFAQILPELKLKMVDLLQKKDKVVAMTGDGVNDAPALKKADVGIAMGESGTDLAKEAADIILLDDDISTIVQAVKSGRIIIDNIQKVISYLISTNLSELIVITLGIFIWGLAARPILPTQILWVNLISDSIAVLPLAFEPSHHAIMSHKPRNKEDSLFSFNAWTTIFLVSIVISIISIITFTITYGGSAENLARAQTLTFTTIVFAQLFNMFNARSLSLSFFAPELKNNKYFWYAFLTSMAVQIIVLTLPPISHFLRLEHLTLVEILISLLISSLVWWVVEIKKFVESKKTETLY